MNKEDIESMFRYAFIQSEHVDYIIKTFADKIRQ